MHLSNPAGRDDRLGGSPFCAVGRGPLTRRFFLAIFLTLAEILEARSCRTQGASDPADHIAISSISFRALWCAIVASAEQGGAQGNPQHNRVVAIPNPLQRAHGLPRLNENMTNLSESCDATWIRWRHLQRQSNEVARQWLACAWD